MKNLYNRFWRWHFFAALFITPLLLTLTISGMGYLFYPEVEKNYMRIPSLKIVTKQQNLQLTKGLSKQREPLVTIL